MHESTRPLRVALLFILLTTAYAALGQTYNMGLGYRRSFDNDWIGFNGANVVRDSIGWSNPYLIGNLPKLNPKNLRYPAGGTANWWNWRTGTFLNRSDLPEGYHLPPKANKLEDFKQVLDTTHADAVLVVNMLTSTLAEQIAMLQHADSIGIPVKNVELGSEFYLDGGDDSVTVVSIYPTAQSYADSASRWADTIHHYFPQAKVAAQGAFNRNNATRRITWDENVFPTLHGEDAITYHTYMSTSESDDSIETGSATFTASDLPEMFYRPFRMWNILASEDLPLVPPGKEIWITEYNMRDHVRPVQGCWGQALFLATQTMMFLNDTRINRLMCHAMCGSAVAGAYYNTITGYSFGSDGNFVRPENAPDYTQYWGLSSTGRAMQQLGLVAKKKIYVSPLTFMDLPLISTMDGDESVTYPSIYGWAFISDTSIEVLAVNLSANDLEVNTSYIFPDGGTYTSYYADPMLFPSKESDISHVSTTSLPEDLTLKAYSITRMVGSVIPAPPPTVSITADGPTTFCFGDSVQLDAGSSHFYYQWSTGEISKTIWAKNNGDYWVRVWDNAYGYWTADTIHITVNMPADTPKIQNIPSYSFCPGDAVTLQVKNPDPALSYSWSNGTLDTSVSIDMPGDYTVTSTNSFGCKITSLPVTLTQYAQPEPVITPDGSTSICYDHSVILDAGSSWKSYAWSNGKVGETITVNESGSYSCTVKDNNNCYGTTPEASVTVHTPANPTVSTSTGGTDFCSDDADAYISTIADYNYQWQQGGVDISGATKKKYYPDVDGSYRVVISDDFGCTKRSDAIHITVNPNPAPDIKTPEGTSICSGESVTLSSNDNPNYVSYSWSSGETTSSITVSKGGDYTLEVTDNNGCTGSAVETVTKHTAPDPVITASGSTDICDDQSVDLNAPSGYVSYNWSNGKHGQILSVNKNGSYSCTVKDDNGCSGTSNSLDVTVHIPGDPTITVTGPVTFCNDGTDPCTLKTISGYSYQWAKGSNNISGATKKSYTPTASANYKVTITDDWGCTKKSDAVSVSVNPLPSTKITVTGGKNYCPGKLITLTAKTVLGATYQWIKDGDDISGAILPTYIITSSGDYTYRASLNGCEAVSGTTTITANCKTEDEQAGATELNSLDIYPNPADDAIHASLRFESSDAEGSFILEISNALGELMYSARYGYTDSSWSGTIPLTTQFTSGSYFIFVKNNSISLTAKLLVERQ